MNDVLVTVFIIIVSVGITFNIIEFFEGKEKYKTLLQALDRQNKALNDFGLKPHDFNSLKRHIRQNIELTNKLLTELEEAKKAFSYTQTFSVCDDLTEEELERMMQEIKNGAVIAMPDNNEDEKI